MGERFNGIEEVKGSSPFRSIQQEPCLVQGFLLYTGKVKIVSKYKRSIWDDLAELGREINDRMTEALTGKKRRQPVPVPIPVRKPTPNPYPHPYEER